MGRKSTRQDKNAFFKAREEAGLTRKKASELACLSETRIEKIEYGKSIPHPDEVYAMAEAYKSVSLCNYYCSNYCDIGQEYVPAVAERSLSQSVVEMLASINALNKTKDMITALSADGKISENELKDLVKIRIDLKRVTDAINSFNLWINDKLSDGTINSEMFQYEEEQFTKRK